MCVLPESPQRRSAWLALDAERSEVSLVVDYMVEEEMKNLAKPGNHSAGLIDGWVVCTGKRESLQADGRVVEKMSGWEGVSGRQG